MMNLSVILCVLCGDSFLAWFWSLSQPLFLHFELSGIRCRAVSLGVDQLFFK